MNNTMRNRKEKQAWQENICTPNENIIKDPVKQLEALPEKHKVLINHLLEYENKKYRHVYPTQTTLGKAMGCGRQRANEIIREVEEMGLISTNYRHMTSCLYKTTGFLRNPFNAQKLGHIFPSLRKLLLLLAIPTFGGEIKTEATQLDLKNYNVLNGSEKKINNGMFLTQVNNLTKNVSKYWPLPQCLCRQPLTVKQKCELAAFPEWLIDQAMFKITDISRIKNLGGYLYSYCSRYCQEPDWIWSSKLKDIYKDDYNYNKVPFLLSDSDVKEVRLGDKWNKK